MELTVQPKVYYWINADSRLGEHGGDGQDVEGEVIHRDVASSLGYGDTGIGEPGHKEGNNLKMLEGRFVFSVLRLPRPPPS